MKSRLSLKNKGLRLAVISTILLSLLLSLSSCAGAKIVASVDADGIMEYNGVKYYPVDETQFDSLIFDSEALLGRVDGLVNSNIYQLRFAPEKSPTNEAKEDSFICLISAEKEKTLFVSENHDFTPGGRRVTNVFMQYKNGFIKKVDNKNDYNTAITFDSIRGEQVTFNLDTAKDNWVSIYACYDQNPVGTFWFGSLVKQEESGKVFYIYPNAETRSISQTFTGKEDSEGEAEYSGVLIDDEKKLAEIQRIIGLD